MSVSVGSHNDLYAKRRAARILATSTEHSPPSNPNPAFLRVKLHRIPIDLFMAALGGFVQSTPRGISRAWLPEDNALLRTLWSAKVHRDDMARLMERPWYCCYGQAHKMGLPPRKRVCR